MRIISGGQTGVDQAALDAAIQLGYAYGGALPKGRLTEAGSLAVRYEGMEELPTPSYSARTVYNIRSADATLVITRGTMGPGTAFTLRSAKELSRPLLHVDLEELSEDSAVAEVISWLSQICPQTLNIAGPRESVSFGIHDQVLAFLVKVLGKR